MTQLEKLFETGSLSKKHADKLNRSWENIDIVIEDIPKLNYPPEGSALHKKELEDVKFHVTNPSFAPSFLNISDKKPEKIFKKFIEENNLNADLEVISKLCNQLDSLILNLKFKYDRIRPKDSMFNMGDDFQHEKIRESKSPAYPSGHTAIAYFIADIIGRNNPEAMSDLTTLADMIAQSRIDNGLHYPSDLTFGRYIGELAASKIIDKPKLTISENTEMSIHDKILNIRRDRKLVLKENFGSYSTEKAKLLGSFIRRSNEIERYDVGYTDCLEASSLFLQGFPTKHCSDNKFIISHLNGLHRAAQLRPIDNIDKLVSVHNALNANVLERGEPGLFRNFSHSSRSGVTYPEPNDIMNHLNTWYDADGFPFVRHAFYEWIHPFCDGNGRSGRIILASELDFDFDKTLSLIDNNYLSKLVELSEAIQRKFLK